MLSDELASRLERDEQLTIGGLVDTLGEGSLALLLMLLMIPSALPIPTGGVTHVLELGAAIVAVQIIAARREVWLPRRLREHALGATFTGKLVPAFTRLVRWCERFSRRRLGGLVDQPVSRSLVGVILLLFVAAAFVAPPFTGLDTLPSLGAVVVCLGLVFSDVLVVAGGIVLGAGGIALEIVLASVAWSLL
ncbi:MAG TPA: exopolysaccharide biosynthesis protein [Acidimicrobiia bacterium]